MVALLEAADRAALSDGKVLITGESGVGKDLIARRIHAQSRRSAHSLVPVNCAGLTESLLESELFGHVKGSFTGAYRDKLGKLQAAHGGTIFLDEVGEMSLRMQAMLLRFLENGEIQAVGSDRRLTTVNVRVIAATNRNLPDLIAAGQFREDLLYRLRVIHLEVPPLRNRTEEIPALVSHFVARTHRRVSFTDEAMQVLARYRWPGNVRELQNVVEQATWLATGEVVDVAQLPEGLRVSPQPVRADARAAGTGRRRVVCRARERRIFVLGSHLSAVPVARHYSSRHARAGAERALDNSRQLPGAAQAVRHVEPGLQAIPQLPRGARVRCGFPGVSTRNGRGPATTAPDPSAAACEGRPLDGFEAAGVGRLGSRMSLSLVLLSAVAVPSAGTAKGDFGP